MAARIAVRSVLAGAFIVVAICGPAAGTTWNVSTFGDLRTKALTAIPGDEIVIAAGSYHVTAPLYVTTRDLTFRGATGNRDDVVLYGNGMNVNSGVLEGFWTAANGIELHDLTIKDFWHHGVHVSNDVASADLADNVVISNLKIQNCGERHIKGSGSGVSNNVLVEDVYFLQTEAYQPRFGHPVDEYNYIGGIDAMHTNNWTIRNCTAVNIRGATGGGRAAFFLWNGVSNLTLEGNTIVRCGHGISIGNPSGPNNSHVDPWHAVGGVIRNNTILRRGETFDWAMELDNTKDFKVYNNTLYSDDASYFRTLQIYDETDEGMTTNLDLKNNIIRGGVKDISTGDWSNSAVIAMGNIVDISGSVVVPGWFVDPADGNFHLTEQATGAIDQATTLAEVTTDIDGGPRPMGPGPDVGADEFASPRGDANHDGKVDGGDYTIWADNYHQAGAYVDGDFTVNGFIDGGDYTIWADNFGWTAGASVPAPAMLSVLALGALAVLRRRARPRRAAG